MEPPPLPRGGDRTRAAVEALGMANGRWRGRPWRTTKSAKRKEKRREEEPKDRRRRHLGLKSRYEEEEEEELLCLSIAPCCGEETRADGEGASSRGWREKETRRRKLREGQCNGNGTGASGVVPWWSKRNCPSAACPHLSWTFKRGSWHRFSHFC
jgi:hypothetical protein